MSLSGALAAIARGDHPISRFAPRRVLLHREAPPALDRDAPGPRCGTCVHRQPRLVTDGRLTQRARCLFDRGDDRMRRRVEVPAWWPGCTDHRERTT